MLSRKESLVKCTEAREVQSGTLFHQQREVLSFDTEPNPGGQDLVNMEEDEEADMLMTPRLKLKKMYNGDIFPAKPLKRLRVDQTQNLMEKNNTRFTFSKCR